MVGIAFIAIMVSQYTKVVTIKGDFPLSKIKKERRKEHMIMTEEQAITWDIRAIYSLEIFEQWLNAMTKRKAVFVELMHIKDYDGKSNLVLSVYCAETQEELEESDPEFWFSYNVLENEFWSFVAVAANSPVTFDTEFFFEQLYLRG